MPNALFRKYAKYLSPEWLRMNVDEGQRFIAVSILCGFLCGIVAVLFHYSIEFIFHNLWEFASHQDTLSFVLVLLLAPTLGGLIVGVAVTKFAPGAAGSGIPQTKFAFYNRRGVISIVDGIWRFGLGSVFVGLGNALGREGPTVHICSSIASKLGRVFFKSTARQQAIVPVGMAAGIGAAFNAPLSAITFVFEELLDKFSTKAIGGIVIGVVTASVVSRLMLGEDPVIKTLKGVQFTTEPWMLIAIPLGILAGFIGHYFVYAILESRQYVKNVKSVPAWVKPAIGGLCTGIFGVSAYFLTKLCSHNNTGENGVFSIGYESLQHAFEGSLALWVLFFLFIFKTLAVIVNYATGGSGGLFAPTLFIGGMLGGIIGVGLTQFSGSELASNHQVIGGCVLLGMGAMFGSVIRCPFTSLFIIFELTGNYTLILPLMFGNILSWQIARRLGVVSIYNALLIQDKIDIRKFPTYRGSQDYRNLPVATIMTHEPLTLLSCMNCEQAIKHLSLSHVKFHGYPVVNKEGELLGMVMHHELYENAKELTLEALVVDQSVVTVTPETSIQAAARELIRNDYQQLPVVSKSSSKKLLGFLTLNDIARQQNSCDEDDIEVADDTITIQPKLS